MSSDRLIYLHMVHLPIQITLLQPDIDQFKNIQRFITVSPQGKFDVDGKEISRRSTIIADPNRGLLSLTNESLPACQQVLQGLSNLLYGFSDLSNICLLDDHNQQASFFQSRLTLVHQYDPLESSFCSPSFNLDLSI